MVKLYDINENYFECIDSKDKAYWLGFIYADGSLHSEYDRLRIELSTKDAHILDKFRLSIESTHRTYLSRTNTVLEIVNKKLYNDLIDKDIIPNKSYNHVFPTNVSENFIHHYIRGCFDGDGCITCKLPNTSVSITGNRMFCEWVNKTIKENTNIKGGGVYKYSDKDEVYAYRIRGKYQLSNFAKWIYNDADLYLERKRNRFVEEKLLE